MDRGQSIALLNDAVADELQAVHKYMYFHLDDQGFRPLSMLFKRMDIEEMIHIERLADRILFLKGEVEITAAGPVEKITDPAEMLKKAISMETGSQDDYNKAAIACGANADADANAVTKQLFESLVVDEERHFDQYDKRVENINRFGLSYLALQSFGQGEAKPAAQ